MVKTTIKIEIDIDVTYTPVKGFSGYRNSFGVPIEPDEGMHSVINEVIFNGHDITPMLTIDLLNDISDICTQEMEDNNE